VRCFPNTCQLLYMWLEDKYAWRKLCHEWKVNFHCKITLELCQLAYRTLQGRGQKDDISHNFCRQMSNELTRLKITSVSQYCSLKGKASSSSRMFDSCIEKQGLTYFYLLHVRTHASLTLYLLSLLLLFVSHVNDCPAWPCEQKHRPTFHE
jgi:hypothetical protein